MQANQVTNVSKARFADQSGGKILMAIKPIKLLPKIKKIASGVTSFWGRGGTMSFIRAARMTSAGLAVASWRVTLQN